MRNKKTNVVAVGCFVAWVVWVSKASLLTTCIHALGFKSHIEQMICHDMISWELLYSFEKPPFYINCLIRSHGTCN